MPGTTLIVVDDPQSWPLTMDGVEVVAARAYITDPRYPQLRRVKLFNLCRSYRYQSIGYYVSLLASARGHRVLPGIGAMQDLKSPSIIRFVSAEIDSLISQSLKSLRSDSFVLSIYFGRNVAKRYDRLSQRLFQMFQAPFLRATFHYSRKLQKWQLLSINPFAANDIPEEHRDFAVTMAQEFLSRTHSRSHAKKASRFDLAILVNPEEKYAPSNSRAIKYFVRAAEQVGFAVELIGKEDFGRLSQFDALFIRETTQVNHHTFRFARRAEAEGVVVIDDPGSILKCTNKVFLAELLERHNIAIPKTMVAHRGNANEVLAKIGLPCILKQPDSAFSQGVTKAETAEEYRDKLNNFLHKSDLAIAQEFIPTEFDWRVGILDRKLVYGCKYYMARRHWQIMNQNAIRHSDAEGNVDTFAVEDLPEAVRTTALKAANLIGDGLYGVDLKQRGNKVYVIEINDNPNIDAGIEDEVLKKDLYLIIMQQLMNRVEQRKGKKQ